MSIRYDLYQNPPQEGSNRKPRMHARVVGDRPAETDDLVALIHSRCTLTEADIRATLSAISQSVTDMLQTGRQVHIEGLGFFSLTLNCPPVKSPQGVRAEVVRFKNIAFRAEQKLKDRFNTLHLERSPVKRHSNDYSGIEVDDILTKYFMDNDYITRKEFQKEVGFTRSTALRKLNQLVADGKLKAEGIYKFPVYIPMEGFYRR